MQPFQIPAWTSRPSADELVIAIVGTEERLDLIRARYGVGQIGEQRSELLIRNYLRVAKTGDYSQTTGPVYKVLSARGVSTMPLPGATPL